MSMADPETLSKVKAGFADGWVVHDRKVPKPHRFKYNMCWCLFDLDQVSTWMAANSWWRHNGFSLFSLYDRDYLTSETIPIKQKVINHLRQDQGVEFTGDVFLFTHPRFLGYGFNSVSFYFCYQHNRLQYILAEINNTPWGEKHIYVFSTAHSDEDAGVNTFEFDKAFHISPFAPMDINYLWRFEVTPGQIKVKMQLHRKNVNVMNVYLDTKITPFVENEGNRYLFKKPFQPWKMSMGIYWQAFKLWIKRVPFYSHPDR